MGKKTQGRRVHPNEDGMLNLEPADYGKHPNGNWMAMCPDGHLGNLANHDVTEYDDGTITVSPSILIKAHDGKWHGFLRAGVWEEC